MFRKNRFFFKTIICSIAFLGLCSVARPAFAAKPGNPVMADSDFLEEPGALVAADDDFSEEPSEPVAEELDGEISPMSSVMVLDEGLVFTGELLEPEVEVYAADESVIPREKYAVLYSDNVNAGTALVTVTGLEEYEGQTVETEFEIAPVEIASAEIKYSSLYYIGKARTQSKYAVVTAVVNGELRTLTRGTDYKITYQNNVEHGTATMIFKGAGNYSGTIEKTFRILRAPLKRAALTYTSKKYLGKALKPGVTVKGKYMGELVALTKGKDYTVTYKNNIYPGTASVIVKGKGNYIGTIKKTFRIRPIPLSGLKAGDIVDAGMIKGITDRYFTFYTIERGDAVFKRINGKSYRKNPDVALSDLRYIKVLHYNFDHEIQVGELIVNRAIAGKTVRIFKELFKAEYEIYSMYLIDRFWTGDPVETDEASCRANNTSAFCYRAITGGRQLSRHAYGMAIDINTLTNPYVWYSRGVKKVSDENAKPYIDRTWGDPHMIVKGDVCWKAFTKNGFEWGGDWPNPIDYQHFEMN